MPDTNSRMSQEERDVTVSGINPETGEYLTPAERKALFKKQRMGSKINPESFRSGTFSSAKKSGGGYGGGAIVKFDLKETIQSGAITKVPNEKKESSRVDETVQEVKVEDLGPTNKEEDGTEFKSILEKLKETFDNILKLKVKQKTIKSRISELGKKKPKKGSKKDKKKSKGKDIFGIGRKIKSGVTKAFGDIFGIFGDVLQFAALNWLSDPKNKETVKSIVNIASQIFKWIDSTVTWGIDTTLTGFSELVGPDNPISTRISGFFKLASVFFALRWLLNPLKIVKDLRRVFGIVKRFGKFVNKTLAKPIQIVQDFVQKALNKVLGKTFKGNLFKGVRRFILKVGGKSLFKVFKGLGRGFTKVVSRIPVLGGLLDFALNVFVFKENPSRAAFKAIGATLLGVIGTGFGGPLGAIIGGFAGDWAGGKVYDIFFGGKKDGEDKTTNNTSNNNTTTNSSGGTPPSGSATGSVKALLNTIRFAEGTSGPDGYNTWFGGRTDMDLTSMTINEVVAEQKRRLRNGEATYGRYTSAAVGAYQMMEPEKSAAAIGLDPATTKFTPEVQDRIAVDYYMKKQARMSQSEIEAPINKAQIAKISGVWASLPNAVGDSAYGQPVKDYQKLQEVYNKNMGPMTTPPPVTRKAKKEKPPAPAIMKPNPPQTSMMPSMSTKLVIEKKMKTRSSATVPIIINNMNSSTMSTTATQLPLNSTSISSTTVLNRL